MLTNFSVYGLKCYPLVKSDLISLDFVIIRVIMKLLNSANTELIDDSHLFFNVLLPSEKKIKKILLQVYVLHQFTTTLWSKCKLMCFCQL